MIDFQHIVWLKVVTTYLGLLLFPITNKMMMVIQALNVYNNCVIGIPNKHFQKFPRKCKRWLKSQFFFFGLAVHCLLNKLFKIIDDKS